MNQRPTCIERHIEDDAQTVTMLRSLKYQGVRIFEVQYSALVGMKEIDPKVVWGDVLRALAISPVDINWLNVELIIFIISE